MSEAGNWVPSVSDDRDNDYLQMFYHDLVEAAGNVFFVTDARGFFVYMNSAIETVMGFTPDYFFGKHYSEVVHPDWMERAVTFYTAQILDMKPETTFEYEVLSSSGERRWVEQILRLIIVEGQIVGCNGLMHDISRRKHAEESRRNLENNYVLVAENTGSIVFAITQNGTLDYTNPAMELATGYSRSELFGMDVLKLIHPELHDGFAAYIQLFTQGEILAPRQEIRLVRKDGSICWLDITANWGELNGATMIIGSALDISERKRIEQQLKESQFFVERINQTIPDMVYVFDLDERKLVYSNRSYADVLGYTDAEIEALGENATDILLPPDEVDRYKQRIIGLKDLKDGEIHESTFRMLHKDGSIRWALFRTTPFERDSAGRLRRVLGLTRDVTEQVQAQELIRHSEDQLRKSLQHQRALNEINFELGDMESFEGMLRRAVELGQTKLGFDRLGILLFNQTTETIMGTFGVDVHGNIRDERGIRHPLSEGLRWVTNSMRDKQRVHIRYDVDLYDNWQVVGHGWNAMALMWKDGQVMGWLAADNLIRKEPLEEYQLEILGMFALSLEHFCSQKTADKKLRESNRRFDQLVTNMPGVVYRIRRDAEGNPHYDYVSPRCKDLTGIEPEALMADASLWVNQIVPEDRVKYEALVHQNLADPQVFRWEGAVIVNGERRWRRIESRPNQLPDGSIAWDGILTDITEAKRAEEALRDSEIRYRAMIENQSEIISRYTPDTIITFVNEASCRYFGKPREYYMGRSIFTDMPPGFHQATLDHIEESRRTGKPFRYEHPIKMLDGTLRWFDWTDTPVFDAVGQLVEFQSVGRDIDERKRAEEERNEYINRLEIIRRVDMELTESLNFDHVLQIALDAATRMTQATAGAIHVLENDYLRVVHVVGNFPRVMVGTTIPLTKGIVGRVARRAIPEFITDVSLDPDYLPNVVETRSQMTLPLVSQDRLIGVINVQTSHDNGFNRPMFDFLKVLTVRIASALDNARLHSITEQHLSEITDLYQQVSELEQLKTQMIRIAAHDLRNPLGVISGYVQMLTEEISAHFTDRNRDQIAAIHDSIGRIDKITRDILTLERIAAGREVMAERVDLTQIVNDAYTQVKMQATQKQQTFELQKPDTAFFVKGDRFLLPETVINLLTNAIKYTPDGGRIEVRLEHKDHEAVFSVKDNGYGIPAEHQEGLFQAFYRVKTKETRGINGTGLGLHLVKSIIERHGGQMYFQSQYGKGSTFGFELPLVETPATQTKKKVNNNR